MLPAWLQSLDYSLLNHLTEYTQNHSSYRGFIYFCADILVLIFPLVVLILWTLPKKMQDHNSGKKTAMMAVVTVVTSLAIKSVINIVYVRPRPFLSHPGLFHLNLTVDPPSFPSSHTMFAFAVAASVYYSGYRRLGVILFILAFLVGFSRIAGGLHYPSDVLGGALIGILTALYLHSESSTIKRYLPNT